MNRYGALVSPYLVSAAVVLISEDRRDRQRRVDERDEHFHSAARVVEADPA
jgi:hypothetical protein